MANWNEIKERGNVIDRRAAGPIAGGLGITGVAIYLLANFLLGGDVGDVLSQLENVQIDQQSQNTQQFEGEDDYQVFASTVLGSNNAMWQQTFRQMDEAYQEPQLVLYRGGTQSACGGARSTVGPHYCPPDNTIYLDETFFDQLQQRFGAEGGDVAEAYVIAHEVGHHVQHELGIMEEVRSEQQRNPSRENELSIQLELQADCFAGLWAYSIKDEGVFQPGEIQEAIDAAAAVGDDNIQERATGTVNPETWNHGSSEQRVEAFTRGFESGNVSSCSIE